MGEVDGKKCRLTFVWMEFLVFREIKFFFRIPGVREKDGKKYYLVQFVGYPKRSWEPEENVNVSFISAKFLATRTATQST